MSTLPPIFMEVENYPKYKETNIGDTLIFHWIMIMGGRVTSNKSVFSSLKFILGLLQCAFVGYVCFTRLPVTSVVLSSLVQGR